MADRIIQTADLSRIADRLNALNQSVSIVNSNVSIVDQHVDAVQGDLDTLKAEFHQFVHQQTLANREQLAETRLVKLRQELEKKFGHYDIVRRMTTGILQATDLGIIHEKIISNATEEVMLSTPGYWLAPCLVALSAWICDKRELAEKAVKEAMKRDGEKTSLFFALICQRADRKVACMKWVSRYLANQDEEHLDRKAILVLTAYANGLWGSDTEGTVIRQLDTWMERLNAKPGFVDQQRQQWAAAIQLKRPAFGKESAYPYLQQYSPTWPEIQYILEGAHLHKALESYFQQIFEQQNPTGKLKEQLDKVLDGLVKNFDDEELPLRREEHFEQLVRDAHGDEERAKKEMKVEDTAFEKQKNLVQLLTDAAMNPELAHADAETQKFAIALSKDWILEAYRDVIAENRSHVPQQIALQIEDFQATTKDGRNERELVQSYDNYIEEAKVAAMEGKELSSFDRKCRWLRYVAAALGVAVLVAGQILIAIVLFIVAYVIHSLYNKKIKAYRTAVQTVAELDRKKPQGEELLRALSAEVVDMRREFRERDGDSADVIAFLDDLRPNQFVHHTAAQARRVVREGGV